MILAARKLVLWLPNPRRCPCCLVRGSSSTAALIRCTRVSSRETSVFRHPKLSLLRSVAQLSNICQYLWSISIQSLRVSLLMLPAEPVPAVILRTYFQAGLSTMLSCVHMFRGGRRRRQAVSSLQKRCNCDAPHSQGSQIPIPAMWKIVHSGHCDA